MLRNYFKTAWRNLRANKFYALVNVAGLSIGLATAILLLLWVRDERSYDKQHRDYQQVYRLLSDFEPGGKRMVWEGVPAPLAVFAKTIPSVQSVVRISANFDQNLANADRSKVMDGHRTAYVDSTFFSLFDFTLLAGDRSHLFPNSHAMVVTQSLARKFFGNTEVIGKVMQYRGHPFTITGVLADFPQNSSIQYDALFPMSYFAEQFRGNGDWKTIDEDLGNYNYLTFVRLQPQADALQVAQAFTVAYQKARNGEMNLGVQFRLQPLTDMHLVSKEGNDAAAKMVQVFLLVAMLVLAIAAINYVNLSTARAISRAKEVSIRKVIGADRGQLFLQFIVETFLLFCLAVILALGLIYLLTPLYNRIAGKNLLFSWSDFDLWQVVAFAALGTLLAASIYPAVLLSAFHPIKSLKGKISQGVGTVLFRKGLVVFQFVISVLLVVATLIIGRQLHYIRKMDLGYDKSYVFTIPLTANVVAHIDAIKNELKSQGGISHVSLSEIYDLSDMGNATGDIGWEGKLPTNNMMIGQAMVDEDFIPTMKIQLLEGSNFTGTATDSNLFLLNETAVKEMGLKPPYTGQPIVFHEKKGYIQGVMKDFNFKPLKEKIGPLLLGNQWKGNILYVRTTGAMAQQAVAAAEKQYKKYGEGTPFSYHFVDAQFDAQYRSDMRTGTLFNVFSGIAIFISCLGLLGLATYTARVRTKEIGIRKVLGASIGQVITLLSKESVALVLLAIIIASPLAWLAMNKWLANFAYRITIQWWMFALAGIAALAITLFTVGLQALRAARANPVKSLREE